MFRYSFIGNILPTTQPFPDLESKQRLIIPEFNWDLDLEINVKGFHFSVSVNSKEEITEFLTLRNSIRELLLLITSIQDYIYTCYHDIEIISYTDMQTGQTIHLNTTIGDVSEKSIERPVKKFEEIFPLFAKKPEYNFLRVSLLDLNRAIKYPKDTTFFCFRAIESLRKFFSSNKGEGWNIFYESLNISSSLKQTLEDYSKETRHGGPQPLTSEEREKILKYTWRIADRFVAYAKNGEKLLDKTKYPELRFE